MAATILHFFTGDGFRIDEELHRDLHLRSRWRRDDARIEDHHGRCREAHGHGGDQIRIILRLSFVPFHWVFGVIAHAVTEFASGPVYLHLDFSELAVPIFGVWAVSEHIVCRAIGPAGTDGASHVVVVLEK